MLQASFTITPTTGDVLATNFTVTNQTTGATIKQYIWDPGTGELVYGTESPTFTYTYPGTYTVSLTATDYDNNKSSATQDITVEIAYRDYIKFIQIPDKYPDPGKLTTVPFKIEILSSNPDKPLIIDLYAANSNSTPAQFIPTKWRFLTPTWKFLDKDQNFVTQLSVQGTSIYKNNTVVAVSGTTEFYYVDSTSVGNPASNCPVLITATLQTSSFNNPNDSYKYPYNSYANNTSVQAAIVWHVNDLFPNLLKVTGNYIDDINPKQWKDIKIPVTITTHSNRSLLLSGSEDSVSEVIFSYPENNTIGKLAPVNLSLTDLASNEYTVDEAPLYFQAFDKKDNRTGGYIFTTITALTSVSGTSIFAQTTANTSLSSSESEFIYPGFYAPGPAVWVSNPEQSTLNRIILTPDPGACSTINYYRQNGFLTDGTVKIINGPYVNTDLTYNYSMFGFSGIFGVAVDPRNYDLVAADAELDRLYRFNHSGELIKTYELSSLNDWDSQKKMLDVWSWHTPSPLASATRYAFYSPTRLSPNPANYIVSMGGVIQPADYTEIDTFDRIIRMLARAKPPNNYPPEGITINVMQIFNPALPEKYISSLSYWTTSNPVPTQTFPLTGSPSLSSDPAYYIVSVDGVLQAPAAYTIDNNLKTINFTSTVPASGVVHVVYVPSVLPPATWTQTFASTTTAFSLTGSTNYKADNKSEFIVNVGGVLQNANILKHDVDNTQLVFKEFLPADIPITVTQFSITDTINIPAAYTPAYVSLDKAYNIWVSLFNTVSVLKFDENFNFLFSVVPENISWQSRAWTNLPEGIDYQSAQFGSESANYPVTNLSAAGYDNYTDEFFLKPPVVETDQDNNCWVTYAHPLCSMLVKYSSTGEILSEISLPVYSTPINLAINSQNNVWVANQHGSSYTYTSLSGDLQLYDSTTFQLLSSITGISRPSHLSIDRQNNLWFSHSQRRIGYLDTSSATLSMWTLELSGGFTPFVMSSATLLSGLQTFDELQNETDEDIGGLAVDVYNRVWVLDNLQNFAWVISATPLFEQAPIRAFKIVPKNNIGYYVNIDTGTTYTETGDYYYRSAQATGDWTGNKWYQKYATAQAIQSLSLSGISNTFSIDDFVNRHQIRRVNESFNTSEYYKSLALPENLNTNPVLFDKFFAAAVGTGMLSANEDMGQVTFERIANFISNHADIDTCNIDQLLSYAEQTGVHASDYGTILPSEIRNFLDIASVPKNKLWGIKDNVPLTPQSIGEIYNTDTDYLTAGTKIYLRNKFDGSISLIPVPPLLGQNIYPVTSFEGYGFVQPIVVNYLFYRYEPVYSGKYIENLVDWDSEYTTQQPTMSTVSEWYGDEGSVEMAFRYLLTKNLFLK